MCDSVWAYVYDSDEVSLCYSVGCDEACEYEWEVCSEVNDVEWGDSESVSSSA